MIDYAFGAQAFEIMENLLESYSKKESTVAFDYSSISIMGKAGI